MLMFKKKRFCALGHISSNGKGIKFVAGQNMK